MGFIFLIEILFCVMRHSGFKHAVGSILMLSVLAGGGTLIVQALWNSIVTSVCGFAALSFWQALGLLALGLTLSGGMLIPLFAVMHLFHPAHRDRRHELINKWRKMSEEQRREFLASRGFETTERVSDEPGSETY